MPRYSTASRDRAALMKLLVEFFGGTKKAELWMSSTNPLFGWVSPESLIRAGRSEFLLEWVRNALEENKK